jgi:hypothetical protein
MRWNAGTGSALLCDGSGPSNPPLTQVTATTASHLDGTDVWVSRATGVARWSLATPTPTLAETQTFGANASAIAASNRLLAHAAGRTVTVRRKGPSAWSAVGAVTTCDTVRALHWDGTRLWIVGTSDVTLANVSRSGVTVAATYRLGVDSNGTRMLPVSSCSAGIPEVLVASAMAGGRFVLATSTRILSYDLRRAPELALLGAKVPGAAVQTVQTDGTWVYARLAGSPPRYSAWRIGPEAAFVDAGDTTATAWLDGVSFGTRFAMRRNGTTVEMRAW